MVPHHLAAIKGKTNHHLQVTVLLTFLIMYHSVVIVITHSTMYKVLKVQYVPSHSYLCYIAQECTYMVPLLFCVSWLCRLHGIYERQRIEQKSLPTMQPFCTMDDHHSNSFFHHASTGTLSLPRILLQHSHRLKPLLQLFPLHPCRTTQTSTAGSLSTWPNPGSNKNQQINLRCAILSLREPCIHSPPSVMQWFSIPSIPAPVFFSIQIWGDLFLHFLAWLWWLLEALVSGRRSQEGWNYMVSCLQLPRLFLKPARRATLSSVSLQIHVCPYRVPLTNI